MKKSKRMMRNLIMINKMVIILYHFKVIKKTKMQINEMDY